MSTPTLYLVQHDLQPAYAVTLTDSTGGAINVTGATIRFTMAPVDSTALTVNRSTAVTITSATAGQFEYRWQAGNTDSTGDYLVEFEVTPASGGKFTVPAERDARVTIRPDLDAT